MILAIASILDPYFKMNSVEYYMKEIYVFEGPSKIEEIKHNLVDLYNKYHMKGLDMACVVFGESSSTFSGALGGNDRASTLCF